MLMRRFLFENFPEIYPSESYMVQPRPLIDSDLLAGEYLQAQLLGCDILFTDDNLPEVQCAHLTDAQIEALSVPDLDHSTVWAMYEKQMKTLISRLQHEYFGIRTILGHRDTSPDLNGDGRIEPNEFIKACPCFDVRTWLRGVSLTGLCLGLCLYTASCSSYKSSTLSTEKADVSIILKLRKKHGRKRMHTYHRSKRRTLLPFIKVPLRNIWNKRLLYIGKDRMRLPQRRITTNKKLTP